MKPIRVDRHEGPLTVGQFYLVPIVRGQWVCRGIEDYRRKQKSIVGNWPVIGPLHKDLQFFGFGTDHYHVDARFLPTDDPRINCTLNYPLHGRRGLFTTSGGDEPLPAPVWRKRKCIRVGTNFDPHSKETDAMRKHFAGQQCAKSIGGWVCPHQNAQLGSVPPVNGVIVCPLHGLHVDAATGKVLP